MVTQIKTELTKQQAIEQGYNLCGHSNMEYQNLMKISEVDEEYFSRGEITIAEKEGFSPVTNSETIRDMIADQMESDWGNDTKDDTEEVYKEVMKLDFSETAKMINEALKHKINYRLTDIILKP